MKSAKPFFEFWIKIGVRAATQNKHVTFYVRAFAAILIPCLLQFPLMAHWKDRHDVVNNGLVPGKRISESTATHKAVSDIGKLCSKGDFVGVNSISQLSSSVLPIVDSRINQGHEENANSTKKVDVGACEKDTKYFHVLCLRFFLPHDGGGMALGAPQGFCCRVGHRNYFTG